EFYLTSDGRWAVSANLQNQIQVWDVERGVCLRTLEGHTDWITGLSLTPDGRRAASASKDRTLRVWDLETGACVPVAAVPERVLALALAGGGDHLCAGTLTGEVLFYDVGDLA
ncbi:MAG: WD40 repeat domain-containing protein, partial [Vicinamibacterales bacterium]